MGNGSPPAPNTTRARRLRLRACTWLVLCCCAAVPAGAARADTPPVDVCIALDPLLRLGCRQQPQKTPAPAANRAQSTPDPTPAPPSPFATAPVASTSSVTRYDPRRLAVTFARGSSRKTIATVLARAHAQIERAIPALRAYMVGVAPARRARALAVLQESPAVASAGREVLAGLLDTNPDDAAWPEQSGLRLVGFPKAWDVTHGSKSTVVAVLDTGVDARQPDLRGALVPGYDFVDSDADPADGHGHGTAVAGIIAARADNHEGVAGICWSCSVMPVRVLDAHGSGDETVIAAGLVWAVDHGARVVNLSLGAPETTPQLTAAIAYAVDHNTVVVAAAGNNGSAIPFYPAADPKAIGVAGTTATDQLYPWSNFGTWVGVAAPGCNIAPALAGGYGPFCGTSSATPVVAGLVALTVSLDSAASPGDVRQALTETAVPLPGAVQYGRIDAARALAVFRPGTAPAPAATPRQPAAAARSTTVVHGTVGGRIAARRYTLPVGAGELKATLVFKGRAPLRLSLVRPASRAAGRSPLRLTRTVLRGSLTVVVTGARTPASFALTLSYVRPRP
jgi:subtilisin family serine protease